MSYLTYNQLSTFTFFSVFEYCRSKSCNLNIDTILVWLNKPIKEGFEKKSGIFQIWTDPPSHPCNREKSGKKINFYCSKNVSCHTLYG